MAQGISFHTPHTCEHHTPITNCLAAIIFLHPRLSFLWILDSFAVISRNRRLCSETVWCDTLIRSKDLNFSYNHRPVTKPHLNALRQQPRAEMILRQFGAGSYLCCFVFLVKRQTLQSNDAVRGPWQVQTQRMGKGNSWTHKEKRSHFVYKVQNVRS